MKYRAWKRFVFPVESPGGRISFCLLLFLAGCATVEKAPVVQHDNLVVLLDPKQELGEDWEHQRLRRADTSYERVDNSFGHTVRATGNESASILFRLFEPVDRDCNMLRWSWFVSKPQPGSDLHTKGMDDVAASVFVLFGDPGMFRDRPVPTLKYAWANDKHRKGEIITGPYHRKYIRTIIARTGNTSTDELVTELVNLDEDFINAFGEAPAEWIHGIALFTDNDDTREPVTAHYGRIELLCEGA